MNWVSYLDDMGLLSFVFCAQLVIYWRSHWFLYGHLLCRLFRRHQYRTHSDRIPLYNILSTGIPLEGLKTNLVKTLVLPTRATKPRIGALCVIIVIPNGLGWMVWWLAGRFVHSSMLLFIRLTPGLVSIPSLCNWLVGWWILVSGQLYHCVIMIHWTNLHTSGRKRRTSLIYAEHYSARCQLVLLSSNSVAGSSYVPPDWLCLRCRVFNPALSLSGGCHGLSTAWESLSVIHDMSPANPDIGVKRPVCQHSLVNPQSCRPIPTFDWSKHAVGLPQKSFYSCCSAYSSPASVQTDAYASGRWAPSLGVGLPLLGF